MLETRDATAEDFRRLQELLFEYRAAGMPVEPFVDWKSVAGVLARALSQGALADPVLEMYGAALEYENA